MAHVKYLNFCDKWNQEIDNPWEKVDFLDKDLWNVHKVTRHRIKKGQLEVKVQWKDQNKSQSWVNFYSLSLQDPTPILKYAKDKHIISTKPFSTISNY